MFKSREIRWFSKNKDRNISGWFNSKGYDFEKIEGRTDFYLLLPGRKDMGVKLREGNIEIKHLVALPVKGKLSRNLQGYFEDYIKWSFNIERRDEITSRVLDGNYPQWINIHKERLGVKLTIKSNKIQLIDIDQEIDSGCQIEYTRIHLMNEIWYSFNLEWFGEEILNIEEEFLNNILGDTKFFPEDSMGYAEFLNCKNSFDSNS